jgi:hypothetical protein
MLAYEDPSGNIQEVPAIASVVIEVRGEEGDRTFHLSGCGINRSWFESLSEIYETLCSPLPAAIKLDSPGRELIMACLKELGFSPPKTY